MNGKKLRVREILLKNEAAIRDLIGQLSVICIWISVFFLAAITSEAGQVRHKKVTIFIFWIVTWLLYKVSRGHMDCDSLFQRWKKRFLNNREFVIVLCISVLSRMCMTTKLQRWDGGVYHSDLLKVVTDFYLTLNAFWSSLRMAGHATMGYGFIMSIGEFLTPGNPLGCYMVHLALTIMAMCCIYVLLQEYWTALSKKRAAFYTFLLSAVPVFWGLFSYIVPDYCIILFFIFMIYEESRRHFLLMTFWLIILAMTKEPAMVIIMGYFLGKGIYYFSHGKYPLFVRVKNVFRNREMVIAALGAIIGIAVINYTGMISWMVGSGSIVDILKTLLRQEVVVSDDGVTSLSAIGFDAEYVVLQIKQVFLLNFSWIASLVIAAAGVTGLCMRKKQATSAWLEHSAGILGSLSMTVLFYMIFITAPLYRYHIFTVMILTLTAIILYENIIRKYGALQGRIEKMVVFMVAILFSSQTFLSVDPLSRAMFPVFDTGKMLMMQTGGKFAPDYIDPIIYNYQFTWSEKALEDMMKALQYDEETLLVGNKCHLKISRFGWNKERSELGIVSDFSPDVIGVNYMSTRKFMRYLTDDEDFYARSVSKYPRVILFFAPYDGESEETWLDLLSPYYEIGERQETDGLRGSLAYYELQLKGESYYE